MAPLVTVKKFSYETGLSVNAIRAYIKKGQWRLNTHFVKASNGRISIRVKEALRWMEGIEG